MIKIYYADISTLKEESVFVHLCEMVDRQRRSKILRCKNKEDQCRMLGAGLLLRLAMEAEGIDYASAEFVIEENGRPTLPGYDAFHFSLSHSDDLAVCGIYNENETKIPADLDRRTNPDIGVDVEHLFRMEKVIQNTSKTESIMNRIATKEEQEWFFCLPESDKPKGLLRIWTGKECFGKRNGKGIGQDLKKENVLDENQYLFIHLTEEYYLSVSMENIKIQNRELIPIDIAKAFLK